VVAAVNANSYSLSDVAEELDFGLKSPVPFILLQELVLVELAVIC
jgi:hypothetical protein